MIPLLFSGDGDNEDNDEWFDGVQLYKSKNATGYKGVMKHGNKFRVMHAGKRIGSYDNVKQAAAAYAKVKVAIEAAQVAAVQAEQVAAVQAAKKNMTLQEAQQKKAELEAELSALDEMIEKLDLDAVDDAE